MGLASALSTALTGLTAAETTIDVVGNNLANSGTVGFKSSKAVFATQFLQTQSLGSQPTANTGGTNPRQIGLGTTTAQILPNFKQGTIEISSNASDMAIQGDGFFIVQGNSGEMLYTRNGIFDRNAQNELITITGNRVLGYGVDENFQIVTTTLQPLTIPLGSAAVAQATRNVEFEGALSPTGDVADTAHVVQSAILGDSLFDSPADKAEIGVAIPPISPTMAGAASGAGPLGPGTYQYNVVYVDAHGNETAGRTLNVTVGAGSAIDLTDLPVDTSGRYTGRRIYRSEELGSLPSGATPTFHLVKDLSTDNTSTSLSASGLGVDTMDDATLVTQDAMETTQLTGNYSYYVTWVAPGVAESRPSPLVGPVNVTNDRIVLSDLPSPTGEYAVPGAQMRIYRNLATNSDTFFRVAEVDPGESYIDKIPDSVITNSALAGFKALDADGPKIDGNTLLVNVLRRDGNEYHNMFQEGTLTFAARKGDRTLAGKDFQINGTTTVQDLLNFMEDASGIQDPSNDSAHPIPIDKSGLSPGGSILTNGRIQFVSNNGVDNAIDFSLSSFQMKPSSGGIVDTPNLGFGTTQEAKGKSAVADFIVYDSLGIPLNVRVTTVLESRNGSSTTYRWFADSPDNDPIAGSDISVGTGLITFDGEGNVIDVSESTVSIERRSVSSVSPLEFELDFTQLSGLATSTNSLDASRQDGSAAGTLSSYIIGEDGIIRGVFSNGVTRNLGQIQLARFGNPAGLEQRGENLFAAGVNSGLPVQGQPGDQGIGVIKAGALELSNTDIGRNLIDLILASTQYRGNTRVVTTSQQLLDELLAIRR